MQIRVYYEDTDMGGIVYHSNYLNFCERARSEAFFKKSLSPVVENGHFVVKNLEAKYLLSSKLGDLLEIKSELIEMRTASFILLQTVYKGEKKVFSMTITLVYLSFQGRPQKLDKNTHLLIKSLFVDAK
jgi:acyl-CoA thioester hydrolase